MKLLAPIVLLLGLSAALYKTKEIYPDVFYQAEYGKETSEKDPK